MSQVTSTDIKKALSDYHMNDFFITECKNGSTYYPPEQGLLKFDGLAVAKSYTKPYITGYEIKISRNDFLQDNKWHLYLQYCNEFYFVVPNGLITKEEIPDYIGLIYYHPETGRLRKKKKALWRKIEEPVGVYKYIIYSRLEKERLPFYNNRAEYAEAYLKDKAYKKMLGGKLGTRMSKELQEANERLECLEKAEKKVILLEKILDILYKYNAACFRREEDIPQELERVLQSTYPKELDMVKRTLETAINNLDWIEQKYCGNV